MSSISTSLALPKKGYFLNKMEYRVLHLIWNVIIDFSQLLLEFGSMATPKISLGYMIGARYMDTTNTLVLRWNVSFGFTFLPIKQLR